MEYIGTLQNSGFWLVKISLSYGTLGMTCSKRSLSEEEPTAPNWTHGWVGLSLTALLCHLYFNPLRPMIIWVYMIPVFWNNSLWLY